MDLSKLGVSGIAQLDISSMDTETLMYHVQMVRANSLEGNLRDQMETMQKNNQTVFNNNSTISANKSTMAELRSELTKIDSIKLPEGTDAERRALLNQAKAYLSSSGASGGSVKASVNFGNDVMKYMMAQNTDACYTGYPVMAEVNGETTTTFTQIPAGDLQKWVDNLEYAANSPGRASEISEKISQLEIANEQLKNESDSMTGMQQLDMIKLQQTMSNMNQAFDMISNAMKKFNETKSGIIRNL